jgi:Site-specific recombinase XerD
MNIKEPIRIRFKKLANGNKSIYLDYYNSGKREYKFLSMYLIPEIHTIDKHRNKETLIQANAIKATFIIELQKRKNNFNLGNIGSRTNLISYIKTLSNKKENISTVSNYKTTIKHIEAYSGANTTFEQIDKKYCEGYIEYLKTAKIKGNLNINSQAMYIKFFSGVLNAAVIDELIDFNPIHKIKDQPKIGKTEITYLTIEEVQRLENTECLSPIIKQAFLFSCYTGLRFSDVKNLTWKNICKDNNKEFFINHVQKKTKKQEYLPIPKKALEFLPKKGNGKIFYFPTVPTITRHIKLWSAGINKNVTFHVARHTYATMLITLGANMDIISKNLGHTNVKTTQNHYAAIENKIQRAAVNLFDKIE